MRTPYESRQIGWVILPIVFVTAALAAFGRLPPVAFIPLGIALIIGGLFTRLTILVTDTELSWCFGFGWPGWKVRLEHIVSATPDRSRAAEGFGLRLTPRGWLYNVHGLDCVEVTLRSGKRFRLGTSEPAELARAIRDRIPAADDTPP